jgi:hypothetical protein
MEEPIFEAKISSMKEAWLTENDEKKDKYYKLKSKQMMNRTSTYMYI